MTFGSYLKMLREKKGLRQSDLANVLGVSTVYICDIEKGRRYPPEFSKLTLIAKELALTPEETSGFYDLAGAARDGVAPDIMEYLNANPDAQTAIRKIMGQQVDYDWNTLVCNSLKLRT